METLRVTYHLDVAESDAAARAEAVALEQTVEVPRAVVRDAVVEKEYMGRVESLAPDPDGGQRAIIAFPVAATALDPAQLLNVIFGNSSLHDDVRCLDFDFPDSVVAMLRGPSHGIEGVRKAAGAFDRPLTCTVIKPMGLSTEALAGLCGTFARAGIDVIKDDHGLADQPTSAFEERVSACLAAVDEAAAETGHRAVYVPNLVGTPDVLRRKLDFAQGEGAQMLMASPMLIGLPVFWELCQRYASVPVLAHPAFAGALRIDHVALFGTLFRLFGADAVIHVSFGSRFSPSRAECRALSERLRRPWNDVRPALPVPAGGIRVENAAEAVEFYGRDAMLLIGGDLQLDAGALLERSRLFADTVREAAPGSSEV